MTLRAFSVSARTHAYRVAIGRSLPGETPKMVDTRESTSLMTGKGTSKSRFPDRDRMSLNQGRRDTKDLVDKAAMRQSISFNCLYFSEALKTSVEQTRKQGGEHGSLPNAIQRNSLTCRRKVGGMRKEHQPLALLVMMKGFPVALGCFTGKVGHGIPYTKHCE